MTAVGVLSAVLVLNFLASTLAFTPLDMFKPLYYRLEKSVASKSIPKAHTVKSRITLDAHPLKKGDATFDHSAWDRLLRKHVTTGGTIGMVEGINTVDYAAISADPDFDKYLAELAAADVDKLPPAEQLALWMNAYNALCIALIVHHEREHPDQPLASINNLSVKEGPNKQVVWNKIAGKVGGKDVSLNYIEHEMLRKRWAEPAVHGCIVCASASCPNLRPEAFVASRLREQMDDQMMLWLQNPTKGLTLSGRRLTLSRIFLWFADDFGGFKGVRKYVPQYTPDAIKSALQKRVRTRYFEYSWSINRKPASG